MKNIGIWLDKQKAILVMLESGEESLKYITSDIEDYHIHGGSGTRFKGGPQDVVQDSRYLEREKHQLKDYFKDLASELKTADQILIFGPAEAPQKFKKELEENYKSINEKVKDVKKADSMTDNQVKAFTRGFFN